MDWIEKHELDLPEYVNELDVDSLAPGLHRLAIALLEDGASRSIRVPALVMKGGQPGLVVGLTAALHGNELNGIPTIHRLFESIDPMQICGTLVGICVANVPAYLSGTREYTDGKDLNRIMPGKPDGNESQVYAHRLLHRIINRFDVLLDLHTASFGRINSLYVRADMRDPETASLARQVGAQIILHNKNKDSTLRGAAVDLGIRAITVEIGDPHVFDRQKIRASRIGLRDVIEKLGLVEIDDETAPCDAVECQKSYWLYTDTGGLLSVLPDLTDRVKEGDPIAVLKSPWGERLRTYRAPEDGIVIGRSTNPVARTGARILHLGIIGEVSDNGSPSAEDG